MGYRDSLMPHFLKIPDEEKTPCLQAALASHLDLIRLEEYKKELSVLRDAVLSKPGQFVSKRAIRSIAKMTLEVILLLEGVKEMGLDPTQM